MPTRHEPSMVQGFLESAGRIVEYPAGEVIFAQGHDCESVLYVQAGGVKLSVVAKNGHEAVVAMLGRGEFFGEGCLAGQPVRLQHATAIILSTIVVIAKEHMVRVLHEQSALSDRFIAHMLARNLRMEDDLVDQLFHSAEQRLARTLLLLARPRERGDATGVMPKVTQTTLGEMIGTTRSRVNAFMKHFERLGFIEYTSHELRVHPTLQAVVDGRDEHPMRVRARAQGDSFSKEAPVSRSNALLSSER